ncbi:unnamed protein product, partial [marine sediment metagenome]
PRFVSLIDTMWTLGIITHYNKKIAPNGGNFRS